MRIRFFDPQEERTTLFVSEYEIRTWLRRGAWPHNWEWTYDFPDLRRDLVADIKFYLAHFCLNVLTWLGVYIQKGFPHETTRVSYREIETDDILTAIETQIEQHMRQLAREPSMIVIGPEARRELMSVYEPFACSIEMRLGERRMEDGPFGEPVSVDNMYVCGIPVFFVPWFRGVVVLPDMTGHWSRDLMDRRVTDRRGRIMVAEDTGYGTGY
jgi:hypothetical protein